MRSRCHKPTASRTALRYLLALALALVCGPASGAPNAKPVRPKPKPVHPCATPDPGWGIYAEWDRSISMGQMLAPRAGGITADGGFDLIVHFHGHEPVRKEIVPVGGGIVLVGIDLGVGSSAYSNAFGSPDVFLDLLGSVERAMAKRAGRPKAHIRRLALSSWSAGFGAVGQILGQPIGKKVDAVILLDSLYAGYSDPTSKTVSEVGLGSFLDFARDALRGRTLLFQTHSSVQTYGYATTAEVSRHMVSKLGGKIRRAKRRDRYGLELSERFDLRGYHVRGYAGNNKPDHCAHIGLMRDVVQVHLRPRWLTPRGYVPRAAAPTMPASGRQRASAAPPAPRRAPARSPIKPPDKAASTKPTDEATSSRPADAAATSKPVEPGP